MPYPKFIYTRTMGESRYTPNPNFERGLRAQIAGPVQEAALDAARNAVKNVSCPHGEPVKVRKGAVSRDGGSQIGIDAHCDEGLAAAKTALAEIGVTWPDE